MSIKLFTSILLTACLAFIVHGRTIPRPFVPEGTSNFVLAEKWIRTELYLGLSRKGGTEVSEEAFQGFIDEIVTPRFPSGLTILEARGQWREEDSTVTKERSKVLVLIYPRSERRAANTKIEEIRTEYKKRFFQQSVLRVDMTEGIKVAF